MNQEQSYVYPYKDTAKDHSKTIALGNRIEKLKSKYPKEDITVTFTHDSKNGSLSLDMNMLPQNNTNLRKEILDMVTDVYAS